MNYTKSKHTPSRFFPFASARIRAMKREKLVGKRGEQRTEQTKHNAMPILRGNGGGLDAFTASTYLKGRDLYDEIREIDVYRNHRESLRPWDRKLPLPVQAEANRRSAWTLNPPRTSEVVNAFIFCVALLLLCGLIPLYSNMETMSFIWRDADKPVIVYTNTEVLLAIWIIVHICSGMALWFIYLTEGWAKHQLVLFCFAITILLDVLWVDVMFYTMRFDYNLGLWIAYLTMTVATIAAMLYDQIHIGALFLLPQMVLAVMIIVYTAEFMKLHGSTLVNAKIQRPFW